VRGRSRAVVGWVWLFAAACGREQPPAESAEAPAEAPAAKPAAVVADDGEPAPAGPSAWNPWARAREAELEAVRAAQEARAAMEAQRAHEELQRRQAELERAKAELEAGHHVPPGTSGSALLPMSPAEPAPAPMSRPEPEPTVLVAPPMGYSLRTEAPLRHQGPQPKLEQLSVAKNAIIDIDTWFLGHGLSMPTWDVPSTSPYGGGRLPGSSGDPVPPEVPMSFRGDAIATAIRGIDHSIAIYSARGGLRGRSVVVRDLFGDSLGAVDLSAWPPEQETHWAQLQDGVLYFCTYHPTYASSTAGKNALLTAVALGTGELLWQSEPLVCNTWSFLLRDGWIISGYGFTDEPDFLYVIDAKTGEVAWKKKLASGPEVILEKAGTLYVRTYDRDYEFAIR